MGLGCSAITVFYEQNNNNERWVYMRDERDVQKGMMFFVYTFWHSSMGFGRFFSGFGYRYAICDWSFFLPFGFEWKGR